jgi:E1A/CREB-binding protein
MLITYLWKYFIFSFLQAQMSSSSCPVNSPIMPPGSQGSHIHCPTLPQQALHQNSPSPVPSRTPTPHHTPPSIGAQQPPATAIPAPVPTPPAMPPGPQPPALHPPSRQTPTPPTSQLPPQVQPSLPAAPSADQPQPQPRSQQSTAASVPTPTAPLLPPQPATPVSRLTCLFCVLRESSSLFIILFHIPLVFYIHLKNLFHTV